MRLQKNTNLFILLFFAMLFFANAAKAQYYFYNEDYYETPITFEFGGSLNAMNALTDIGGKKGIGAKFVKDLNMGKTHLSGGVFVSVLYKYALGLRLEGTFGEVSANDNVLAGVTDIAKERYNRNVNFRSNITEIALMAELHPLFMFIDWPSKDVMPPRFSPYAVGGVGYFSFNPQAELNGRLIDLQPLSTEGQGFAEYPNRPVYKLKQMNFPVGVGVKYDLSPLLNVRAEFLYRILRTDYLDDVSTRYVDPSLYSNYFSGSRLTNAILLSDRQIEYRTAPGGKRGSPLQKDAYFTASLKLSLILGRERIR